MLSRLGRVWFSNTIARLARLSWPRGTEIRRRPYIICARDRYKVRRYKGEVLITLVLVLDVMLLAIIYTVTCVYSKWFRVKYLIG